MLISLSYRFVFIANLKTASTAIEAALRPFSDIALVEARFDKHLPFVDFEERFSWVFDIIPRREFLIFGVLRDPLDYMVSLYNSHCDARFKDIPSLYTGGMTFDNFLTQWAAQNPDQLTPQHGRFLNKKQEIAVDYIISFDQLPSGLTVIYEKIGIPASLQVPHINISHRRVSVDELSPLHRQHIERHLGADRRFIAKFCNRFLSSVIPMETEERENLPGTPRGFSGDAVP